MKLWKNLAAAALLGACAQAYAAPILSFDTGGATATLGSTRDVAVTITDIADLYGYQFSISYDARTLRAIGVTEGGFLGTAGTTFGDTGVIDNGSGTISFVFNALVGAVPGAFGSGTLANIRFEAIGIGNTALAFGDVDFLDSGIGEIALGILPAQFAVVGDVAEVPEPASILLVGAGLIGAAALRRRSLAARG